MLPSITAKSSLLLLTFVIGAASATGGGNAKHMLPPAMLPETTMTDLGVTAREEINMTLFNWMYNETEKATHLTICTEEFLLVPGEVEISTPRLVYTMDGGNSQTNIEGNVLDVDPSCSRFSQDGKAPLASSETLYRLSLIVTNSTNAIILKSGSVTFAMPVETYTLYCNGKPYTRASGLTGDLIFDLDHPCINDDLNLGDDLVCYLDGEFSSTNLCYTTDETGFRVCLQGSSLARVEEVGHHHVSHLAYKGVPGLTDAAHLSLTFDGPEPTGPIEALIWKQGKSFATLCQDTICLIPDFTSGFARYDVCAVTFDGDLPIHTSNSSITDLNAHAFAYSDPLLQFDYTNGNEDRYYIAYLMNNEDKKVTVDCSGVPSNRTCRGYFEEKCTADSNVAVEYANAAMSAAGNKVMFPCPPQSGSRRR